MKLNTTQAAFATTFMIKLHLFAALFRINIEEKRAEIVKTKEQKHRVINLIYIGYFRKIIATYNAVNLKCKFEETRAEHFK